MPSWISSRERWERSSFVVQVYRLAEAAGGDVVPHGWVQLGEPVRQLGPVDDLVGDAAEQLLGGRQLARPDIGLVDLRLRGRELELQLDPKYLRELLLLVDGIERRDIEIGELADVVLEARLGDRDRDVVGEPLLHRLDDDRRRRIGLGGGDAHAFGFELVAQDVEQVAGAEHLQRLCAVRAHLGHQPQTATDDLLGQDLGLGRERAQTEHDGHVPHVPALAQHHHADDRLDLALGLVDVAGRLARLVEVLLGDLARGVGVDHQDLRLLEAELLGLPEVLADRVGVDVLLRHDEEHRLGVELLVDLVVLLPALDRRAQPVAVLLANVRCLALSGPSRSRATTSASESEQT